MFIARAYAYRFLIWVCLLFLIGLSFTSIRMTEKLSDVVEELIGQYRAISDRAGIP
jgi:hypothetical protein